MAYKKGDIEVITEESINAEFGLDPGENPVDYVHDSRADVSPVLPVVALPHSCDRWIIGGIKEVRQLVHDLTEALHKIETKSAGTD